VKSIKTLGLAAVLALALTAFVGVSSASAVEFKSEASSTTWRGSRTGTTGHIWTFRDVATECKDVSFVGATTEISLATLTVSPELNYCVFNGVTTSWAINGCKYRFHPNGEVDIVGCEPSLQWNTSACNVSIKNQNGIGTVKFINEGSGSSRVIRAVANLEKITYTESGGFVCTGIGGTFSDGKYKGEWLMKGNITHPVTFNTEVSSVSYTGKQLNSQVLTIGTGETQLPLSCSGVSFGGVKKETEQKSLEFVPSYSGCTFNGTSPTVQMRGCSFVLNAAGTLAIAGTKCAAEPIHYQGNGCSVDIGPQTLSKVSYTNKGSGSSGTLVAGINISGLTYNSTGASCLKPKGTYSDGTYKGEVELAAASGGFSWGEVPGLAVGVWVE
jgi:hypothetical protein